jgi:hypothetical protein
MHVALRWIRRSGPDALFMGCIVLLALIAGSLMTLADVSPSQYVRDAYRAAVALKAKHDSSGDVYGSNLWMPARTAERGVTVHDSARAYPGLTLYTTGRGAIACLIDMNGQVVHEWHRPFSTVWDDSAAVRHPVPDSHIYFERAVPLGNGELLAVYVGIGDTPWGYGLVKLDKDSNVVWKNLDQFHHDIDVDDHGQIHGLTHSFRERPIEGAGGLRPPDHLQPPLLEDFLVVLGEDGQTRRKISLLDAVNHSALRHLFWSTLYHSLEDPLHTNGVDIVDGAAAAQLRPKIPVAAPGQVLLSFRDLGGGTVALLDIETERIVWAMLGPWVSQHDPDILPNGNVLLFDNLGHLGDEGLSRVLEVDPRTSGVVWSYAGSRDRILESSIRSAQQRLPNGNTLITESDGGRLLEVTPEGDIVWEFVEPARGGAEEQRIPIVNWARRVEPSYFTAEFPSREGITGGAALPAPRSDQ